MLKVFVLTVVLYYNSGYSGTTSSQQYYYPTNEACVFAAKQWKTKFPIKNESSTYTRTTVANCEVAYLPKY